MNWRLVVVLAATLAGQLPAYGQDTSTFVFRSDDPRDCLIKPSAAAPAYPDNAASGAGGVVRAKMNFAAIEQQPRVDIFTNTAGEPFNVAVRAHLATYRLSCAALLGRQLVQEFQFVPGTATVRASSVRTNRESGDRSSCPISIPSTPRYPENTSSLGAAQLDRRRGRAQLEGQCRTLGLGVNFRLHLGVVDDLDELLIVFFDLVVAGRHGSNRSSSSFAERSAGWLSGR